MRPSSPLAWKPIGYGTRSVTHLPSTSASSESVKLPVAIGTLRPEPERVELIDPGVVARLRAAAVGHVLELRAGER